MNKIEVIDQEQAYFDVAREEQERALATSDHSAEAAVNTKAASDLRRQGQERRARVNLDEAVAERAFEMEDGETLYVGKHAISNRDSDRLVIAWQSPVARDLQLATATDPRGVHRRRSFATTRNRIDDFDDTVFAALLAQVEELLRPEQSFDDALLRDLDRDRTGEMRDIVKTIQAAQYDLIQAPLDRLMVIQGGPGTGKTAIALHRVSYLLFNHDELHDDEVLVVGPTPTFTRYIKSLLPSLGDIDIRQDSLGRLGPVPSDRRPETDDVTALKGEWRMAELLRRGLAGRIRPPESSDGSFPVSTRAGTISLPNSDVAAAIDAAQQGRTYAQGRAYVRSFLAEALASRTPGTVAATAQQVDSALDRLWPSLTPAAFIRELFGSRDRLFEAAGVDFSAHEASALYRQSADRVSEETWSDADVALLDEADFLINGAPERFLHVVVDEAQDLSPMQLRSLRRRSNGSMTLVGDLAQSTGSFARSSWDEIVSGLEQDLVAEIRELEFGYRVPRQVMELAAQLLPIAAPGVASPRVVRDAPADPALLEHPVEDHPEVAVQWARDYAGRGLSVGVITPSQSRHLIVEEFDRQGVKWHDADAGALGQGINLVSAAESKGLEFDAVVVASPHVIVEEDPHGHRLLYIALTRTTRYLTVVHAGDPLALDAHIQKDTVVAPDGAGHHLSQDQNATVELEQDAATADGALPESPPIEATGARAPGEAKSHSVRRGVISAAAADLAAEVRDSVPSKLWPEVINALRQELGVTSEEILDLLD